MTQTGQCDPAPPHAAIAFDPVEFRPYLGTYRVGAERTITLGMRPSEGSWDPSIFLYRDAECLVPLQPVGGGRFLSERGETLILRRADPVAVGWQDPPPSSAVELARVLTHLETDVAFESGGVALSGTILEPPGRGPFPGMVLTHGTFPARRDFYRLFAELFVAKGIAVLVFDKRGHGLSTGDPRSTIVERADDAEAAVRFLGARPNIDRVGLWGFSNSTWSIPLVAARMGSGLACLIAFGASGVSMGRAEAYRKSCELREAGIAEELIADVERTWAILYDYVATGVWQSAWDAELSALLSVIRGSTALEAVPLRPYVKTNAMLSPIPPAFDLGQFRQTMGGVMSEMGRDPTDDYERVRCPVLFLVGELDANLPARESAAAVARALEVAPNPDHTVKVYPQAGHYLNRVAGPAQQAAASEEIPRLSFCFASGVLEEMSAWAAARLREQG